MPENKSTAGSPAICLYFNATPYARRLIRIVFDMSQDGGLCGEKDGDQNDPSSVSVSAV